MHLITACWERRGLCSLLLLPLSGLFCLVSWLRRSAYRFGLLGVQRIPVPVIVVGNISVGGTGKTPLVIWLIRHLRTLGYRPGIITRGYGGSARTWPQQVVADSDPALVGDEPVLLARRAGCPVVAAPDRPAAGRLLLMHHDCDILVADDGLQHYPLARDLEIAVVDGVRRFGNRYCLPAGPLREPVSRLRQVDLVVVNGAAQAEEHPMVLVPDRCISLKDPQHAMPVQHFAGKRVHAVAGIGRPERFFDSLRGLGIEVIEHPFPDHHLFTEKDLDFSDRLPVLMTEKDAVKCAPFAGDGLWYLAVNAKMEAGFEQHLNHLLRNLKDG